jgi:hypothetical protein
VVVVGEDEGDYSLILAYSGSTVVSMGCSYEDLGWGCFVTVEDGVYVFVSDSNFVKINSTSNSVIISEVDPWNTHTHVGLTVYISRSSFENIKVYC